jgi:uncharacterized protein
MPSRQIQQNILTNEAAVQFALFDAVPWDGLAHVYHYDDGEVAESFPDPLHQKIIASEAFQRLKDVRFLGAIDYLLYPENQPKTGRHTRFDHSLGVGRLARRYAKERRMSSHDERLLVLAALLHDIGHGPLSHSLEPAFSERFGIDHHTVTAKIVRGEVPIGAGVYKALLGAGINANLIVGIISGEAKNEFAEVLCGPINVDTVEGIFRCYSYFSNAAIAAAPIRVVKSLVRRAVDDIAVLDAFWQLKGFVYNHFIQSDFGLIADYTCENYLRTYPVGFKGGSSYFQSEVQLKREHPDLFKQLSDLRKSLQQGHLSGPAIEYVKRTFLIDAGVVVTDLADLRRRYTQKKTKASLKDSRH